MSRPSSNRRFIEVRVKPAARESMLSQDAAGAWHARLRAAPSEGKANAELIALVARQFGVPRAAVSIQRGASGRIKLLRIDAA